jgi:hypothetical protein
MSQEIIPEKMPGRKMVVPVDLDAPESLMGVRSHYTGIPIYTVHQYEAPPGPTDNYEAIRKWYRNNTQKLGGIYVLHKSDLEKTLAKAPQADALDYLLVEDEAERAKHDGWREPGNEAIEIAHWIFPANAINKAILAHDFDYDIVIVSVRKSDKEIDRVYYFVDAHEHIIKYSHHFRGKRPAQL